jgi:hypothetical protein
MTTTEIPRCAGPQCSRPLEARGTGRPGRYCSANCRQAAYRERVRQADAERDRAEQLAEAKAEQSRLWRPLEACGFHELPEIAAAVVAYASDLEVHIVRPGDTPITLADVLLRLRTAAARLEGLAVGYRDATDTAARLAGAESSGWRVS